MSPIQGRSVLSCGERGGMISMQDLNFFLANFRQKQIFLFSHTLSYYIIVWLPIFLRFLLLSPLPTPMSLNCRPLTCYVAE